ncbi:MAG: hypothetical protein OXI22_13280 [Defluviicoccus sp.]|nr:hypothetical protein [Defluviicoccus sp.]MDE0384854.1 hypothetical protein [Defluviicoccus sp.]
MPVQSDSPYDEKRGKYVEILRPLFLPDDPVSHDIINYFASLLRVFGKEDGGWDPYAESRATIEDLNSFFKIDLPEVRFPDSNATLWRIGLLLYGHIVEMDAPYEVLANLLRFRLGKGYSPDAFSEFLTDNEKKKKSYRKRPLPPGRKIQVIKELSAEAGLPNIGAIFDDFYNNHLRNAVGHSDFILADDNFRCRGNLSGTNAFRLPYERLDEIIRSAKAFIAAFFQMELTARQVWGCQKHRALPYDRDYKGLMEVLVDVQDAMCGFRVHWPNGSDSTYRRTADGTEMINCLFDPNGKTIALMVGRYAQDASDFSPLVERNAQPVYSKLEGCDVIPAWPSGI